MSAHFKDAPTNTVDVDGTPFAYREAGTAEGVPLVLLQHVTGGLDDWDPAVVDGLAAERRLVLVDLRGVGRSGGTTPDNFEAMAADTVAFLSVLGLAEVDLLGYSLGGIVAQVVAQRRPGLVRRLILAATAPAGAPGPAATGTVLQTAIAKAQAEGQHPKRFLFFPSTPSGEAASDAFLARLGERTEDLDAPVTDEAIGAQLTALAKWEQSTSPEVSAAVRQPVLVVNGDDDTMWPTLTGAVELARLLPDARLALYPGSGHGGIFQFHELFVGQALDFLRA